MLLRESMDNAGSASAFKKSMATIGNASATREEQG